MFLTRSGHRAVAAALVAVLVLGSLMVTASTPAMAVSSDSPNLLTWTQLAPGAEPTPRVHPALAFDAATGTTVLFGGRAGTQVLGDTWTWNGTMWTAQTSAASPPALESASMAYDNIGHQIVLFGGIGIDGNASAATWTWDGTVWTQRNPAASPPARYAASIASDGVTGTDVLFGGLSAPGSSLGDTWSWNGTTWVAAATSGPTPRSAAAMTFDPARGLVVLFGGTTGSDSKAETWTWDGTAWTQQNPSTSPPARNDAAFAFDPGSDTAVLFGGIGGGSGGSSGGSGVTTTLRDTWLWNGSTWSTSLPLSVLPTLSPPARSGASAALAPAPERLVLFGGQSADATPAALGDMWTVSTVLSGPTTSSTTLAPAATTTPPSSTTVPPTTKDTSPSSVPIKTPPTTAPPSPAHLAVGSRSVHPGDPETVSGSGFRPGAHITITLHSPAVVVGHAVADDQGHFSVKVLVPHDAPMGEHHFEAQGQAQSGGQATVIAKFSVATPPAKQSWLLIGFMVALTLLLAAGAGVVLTASVRRHPRPAGD